tara:strand:+ start:89 stop:232 length:144 start_codon:yes stop_codon:yes gene_type:complete
MTNFNFIQTVGIKEMNKHPPFIQKLIINLIIKTINKKISKIYKLNKK